MEAGLSRRRRRITPAQGLCAPDQPSPASIDTLPGGGTLLGLLLGGVATARGGFGEPHLLAGPPVFRPQWLPSNREPLWLTFLLAPFLKSTGLSYLQTLSLPSSSDLPHPPQPLQGQAVVKPKTFSFSQMLRFWVSVVENGTIEEGQIQ